MITTIKIQYDFFGKMKDCKKIFDLEKGFIKSFVWLYVTYSYIWNKFIGFVLKDGSSKRYSCQMWQSKSRYLEINFFQISHGLSFVKKWGTLKKRVEALTSISQLQIVCNVSWKLYLNLCSRECLDSVNKFYACCTLTVVKAIRKLLNKF